MPKIVPLSFAVFLSALVALPTVAPAQMTIPPEDEKRAEANVFMNAKVIAIDRTRDRIEIRDNNGVKRTLALDDDATLPAGRVKSGTEVIIALKQRGATRRVVSVQPSEPAPAARVPESRSEPTFIPAPDNRLRSAAEQLAFQSGTVPYVARSTGRFVDPATGLFTPGVAPTAVGYGTSPVIRTFTNADLATVGRTTTPGLTTTVSAGTDGTQAAPLPMARAVQAFEASMARLAARVEEVDSAFAGSRSSCLGLPSVSGRSWMGIWDGESVRTGTHDNCESVLSNAARLGESVQLGVRAAEDQARRSGVLPGVRRQIRAQYGMEWEGWDH